MKQVFKNNVLKLELTELLLYSVAQVYGGFTGGWEGHDSIMIHSCAMRL